MSASRIFLGAWRCPSGNSCDVFFRRERSGLEHLEFEWDQIPLSPTDQLHYRGFLIPRISQRLAEYQEKPVGRTVVVTL